MKEIINHKGLIKSVLFIPIIFVSEIIGYLLIVFFGFEVLKSDTETSFNETSLAIQKIFSLLITLLLIWVFMRYIDKQHFIKLGFQINNRFKDFLYGILLGFSIMFVAFLILLFLEQITFTGFNFDINRILVLILLFVVGSVYEEVIFRGYVLKNLLETFNPIKALFISSLFFSIIHGSNPNVTILGLSNIFLAGFFLGTSYIFTKNLWFPVALHFSWNFFQSIFGFRVSGLDFYSVIEFDIIENNFLNGGEFGFESSILSNAILVLSTLLIWKYFSSTVQKNI
jgi:membrane protease YdiL (CAAX protease family)